ncbi:hypothetical protein TNCV_4271391 [Trichonephila clavipes]|nr:hypothetical protein TNCV_4271391 [Trichonephila clavipes]
MSSPKTVQLQAFTYPSYQNKAITDIKPEPAVIRKHYRSSLRPSRTTMAIAWSQWNIQYRAPGLELSLD